MKIKPLLILFVLTCCYSVAVAQRQRYWHGQDQRAAVGEDERKGVDLLGEVVDLTQRALKDQQTVKTTEWKEADEKLIQAEHLNDTITGCLCALVDARRMLESLATRGGEENKSSKWKQQLLQQIGSELAEATLCFQRLHAQVYGENDEETVSGGDGTVLTGHIDYVDQPACSSIPDEHDLPQVTVEKLKNDTEELQQLLANNSLPKSSSFFKGLTEWGISTSEYLASKKGIPAQKQTKDITAFLNNKNASNYAQLYLAASRALKQLQSNPGSFCGGGGVSAITDLGTKLAAIEAVDAGVQTLLEGGAAISVLDQLREICQTKTDCFWRAMHNATGDPKYLDKYNSQGFPSKEEITRELEEKFGGENAPNPNVGPHGQTLEGFGVLIKADYDQVMQTFGTKGSEGLVFVHWTSGIGSHVINVKNFTGSPTFIDDQVRDLPRDKGNVSWDTLFRNYADLIVIFRYK